MDVILFLTFALLAVASAINLVVQTHPITSALSLVGVMCSLAVLYLLLGGEFIAAAQVIVYAGAIMVLFVFVIMLLNAGAEKKLSKAKFAKAVGIPGLVSFVALITFLLRGLLPDAEPVRFGSFTQGGPSEVGRALFTQYLLPFEVVSVLVLIAIVGAVVLAHREIE